MSRSAGGRHGEPTIAEPFRVVTTLPLHEAHRGGQGSQQGAALGPRLRHPSPGAQTLLELRCTRAGSTGGRRRSSADQRWDAFLAQQQTDYPDLDAELAGILSALDGRWVQRAGEDYEYSLELEYTADAGLVHNSD